MNESLIVLVRGIIYSVWLYCQKYETKCGNCPPIRKSTEKVSIYKPCAGEITTSEVVMFLTLLHKYICNNIRCGFPPKLVPDFETGNARTKIHLQTGSSEAKDMRFPQHKGLTLCTLCTIRYKNWWSCEPADDGSIDGIVWLGSGLAGRDGGGGWGVFETGNILNKERLREYNKEVSGCKKALGTY